MDEHMTCPPPRLSVAALTNKTLAGLMRNCNPADLAAAQHYGNPHRRRQFLQARLLARGLLPPGLPSDGPWRIEADREGRPLVLTPDGAAGPDLSVTHSGAWVAAAIAPWGRVGIDVETPRPGRDVRAMAEAYFSPPERAAVAEGGQGVLLALWTMREALAKLSGGGVAAALAQDGAALISGRNATCRGHLGTVPWVLAHRDYGDIHMALAWSAPSLPAGAAAALSSALRELSVTICIMPAVEPMPSA